MDIRYASELKYGCCCPDNTLVRIWLDDTRTAWKRIDELTEDSILVTADGGRTNITEISYEGEKYLHRIIFEDKRYIDVPFEQMWSVYVGKNVHYRDGVNQYRQEFEYQNIKYSTYEISRIYETSRPRHSFRIQVVIHPDINDIELPVEPYTLGALLGDGFMTYRAVGLATDLEIIEKVMDLNKGEIDATIYKDDRKQVDYFRLTRFKRLPGFKHLPLKVALHDLGLIGTHSATKFIPAIYFDASVEQKLCLLQGLLDTDGAIRKIDGNRRGGMVTFYSTSIQLIDGVTEITRSLGGKAYAKQYIPSTNAKSLLPAWCVNVRLQNPSNMLSLARKKQYLSDSTRFTKNWYLRIDKIEMLDIKRPCYSIKIADDSLIVLKDYLVVSTT